MEKTFKILNEEGMHARPAGAFVKIANEFKSAVTITAKDVTKNGKSIMGIMSLGLQKDDEIKIIVTGEDEAQALAKFENLINNKFQL